MMNKLLLMVLGCAAIALVGCFQDVEKKAAQNSAQIEKDVPLDCDSMMVKAIDNSNLEVITDLLQAGCFIDREMKLGERWVVTPLQYALQRKKMAIGKFLLERGANPNIDLGTRKNPLNMAVLGNQLEMVKILIKHGAFINGVSINADSIYTIHGSIPLSIAVRKGNLEIVDYLLKAGADVNTVFGEGGGPDCMACPDEITVMHQIVDQYSHENKVEHLDEITKILLTQNPDLNITSRHGFTPLDELCLFNENTELADLLIANGAKLETENFSALHAAVMFSNVKMVEYLLKLGADPNYIPNKDEYKMPPLITNYDCCGDGWQELITIKNRIKTVELLLRYGADPTMKNQDGKSFIDKCRDGHREELREFMLKKRILKKE